MPEHRDPFDVCVLGAGFAGSLTALILNRLGERCLLIERGRHPRFAIGESSTPLASVILGDLARRHDLPGVLPLTKYGAWVRSYPDLQRGLKRGFSFFKHRAGESYSPGADNERLLLVGANASDEEGDTHWFREHVDEHLVRQAVDGGVDYLDRTTVERIEKDDDGMWRLVGKRHDGERDSEIVERRCRFLVDAGGPQGPLREALGLATTTEGLRTDSWSVFTHFEGVRPWTEVLGDSGVDTSRFPFDPDAAALHHVLDDGWMWVLRFDHGITSAGIAFDGRLRHVDSEADPAALWQATLRANPAIERQFATARPVQPWIRTARLQRRVERTAGADWALLPHAAGFIDPLFSTGIAHTLLGIERLARRFGRRRRGVDAPALVVADESRWQEEIAHVDRLVVGCYDGCRDFGRFAALSMYYFAGAIAQERHRRRETTGDDPGFLGCGLPALPEATRRTADLMADAARRGSRVTAEAWLDRVAADLGADNPAGLADRSKRGLYPHV